jgi:hypothetical protein
MRHVVAAIVILLELLVAAYVALMTGLLTAWPASRHEVVGWTGADWLGAGTSRLLVALLVAVAFAFVAEHAHRHLVSGAQGRRRLIHGLPLALAILIFGAGVAGSLRFVVEQSRM